MTYRIPNLPGVKPVLRGDKTTGDEQLDLKGLYLRAIFFGRKRDFSGFFANGV